VRVQAQELSPKPAAMAADTVKVLGGIKYPKDKELIENMPIPEFRHQKRRS
jgi:hypothetical protein